MYRSMNGTAIGILVLLVVLLGIGLLVMGEKDIVNYPPKNSIIVAFGDSLVEGVGATEGNDIMSVLGGLIGREITNLGVSGNTTEDGVKRMKEVSEYDPGIVILLLGGNDTLRRIDENTTEANLRTLIEFFQANGSVVVLLGVRGGILSDRKADMYETLADEYGAVLVDDVLDGILLRPEFMHDGIHPNDRGYALIAERLEEVFEKHALVP
jgi:acyl-CoA thioesterase I